MQDVPENERTIVVHDFPTPWASARTKAMLEVIKQANVKVVDTVQSDAANLVDGTRKVVSDQLTKHPDVKGIYLAFDSAAPGAAQAVGQKFAGKAFPERPFVATFHGDLATLDLMRRGAIDMVVDVAYDATAFVAADQAAQFFARGTEISKEPRPDYPITFLDQVVLEADGELPAQGQYRETEDDFVTFFTEKWKKEFTNLGGGGGQSTDE
jgi:ABC-type sugar transport system substrate-binding protein